MAQYRKQQVIEVLETHDDLIKVRLDDQSRAYCFPMLNGSLKVGDFVIVNTTAVDLNLGTGGWHFVLWNLSNESIDTERGGHIMKLRYTPLQLDSGVEEEFDSWDHSKNSLDGMPVIAAPLHSHIPAIAAYVKNLDSKLNISVIISDGASLPLALSDTLRELKQKKLVDSTITYGHSFGGDFEALNIYTALLCAKYRAAADLVIVSMGPGIVGTNSEFGFTGIEVAYHLDVAKNLGAKTFGVVRASNADPRERHRGISHHSLTTYSKATNLSHSLGIIKDHELSSSMEKQISENGIDQKHSIEYLNSVGIVDLMESFDLKVSSMGRTAREDELFFEMAAAAGQIAIKALG